MAGYGIRQDRTFSGAADLNGDAVLASDRSAFFGSAIRALSRDLRAVLAIWFGRRAALRLLRRFADARIVRWAEHVRTGGLICETAKRLRLLDRRTFRTEVAAWADTLSRQMNHPGRSHPMPAATSAAGRDIDLLVTAKAV